MALKAQACTFVREKGGQAETGFAFLNIFDLSDVTFIIDSEGNRLPDDGPWDYHLVSGPLSYCDPCYQG